MKRIKITPPQLGQILFDFVIDITENNLNDKEVIKNLRIENNDRSHLLREMIIINMFTIILVIQGSIEDEKLENEVLDSMLMAYYNGLTERCNFSKEQIAKEHSIVLARYKEYNEAAGGKEGHNWLMLTKHMLDNLREEKTLDFFATTFLTGITSLLIKTVPDMINKYEVVKN